MSLGFVYFISSVIGAFLIQDWNARDVDILDLLAWWAILVFFGIVVWPALAFQGITFAIVVFCIFILFIASIIFETISNTNKKYGDLPLTEDGLLQRIKRIKIMFYLLLFILMVLIGIIMAIY